MGKRGAAFAAAEARPTPRFGEVLGDPACGKPPPGENAGDDDMILSFDKRVAIITGAGRGLGRAYALELARRGARILVNDTGGSRDGVGGSDAAAKSVVEEIRAKGGHAIAHTCSVADEAGVAAMVAKAKKQWGRVDILINNAGIRRDYRLSDMSAEDFREVLEVDLIGAFLCTKAVWEGMRTQCYGRILMTCSAAGLFGNFGKSSSGAAKMGVVGLMNSLAIEGARNNVRVNAIAPLAATRMITDVLPFHRAAEMSPEAVVPAAVYLVSEDAPNRVMLAAGGGGFERAYVTLTRGVRFDSGALSAEGLAAEFEAISRREEEIVPDDAFVQSGLASGQL